MSINLDTSQQGSVTLIGPSTGTVSLTLPSSANTSGWVLATDGTGILGFIPPGTGASGVEGSTGATGPAGLDGATGATGSTGPAGATGATGLQGSTGLQGGTGATGLIGATGAAGGAGDEGATGATGNQGSTGATGFTGATGGAGVEGATGATGETGATGAIGSTGATGATGPVGATGAAGGAGSQGATGLGYDVTSSSSFTLSTGSKTFTVNKANAYAIGNRVQITYTSNTSNFLQGVITGISSLNITVLVDLVNGSIGAGPYASWTFSIAGLIGSTGATGTAGSSGATGATGPGGLAGNQGSTGATGQQGNLGATGATGPIGATGGAGGVGNQGTTGATGPQGATGATGATGLQGSTGATGPSGTGGATGATGTGIAGANAWTPQYTASVITSTNYTVYTKTGGTNGSWDGQVYSIEGFTRGAFAAAMVDSTTSRVMFGLNSDPTNSTNFADLDYAFYFNQGSLVVYESGTSVSTYGAYTTATSCLIVYDGATVRYYVDGVQHYSTPRVVGNALYFDSSFNTASAQLKNVAYGAAGEQGFGGATGFGYDAGAANQVLYKDASNLVAGSANLTFDGTNLSLQGALRFDSKTSWNHTETVFSGGPTLAYHVLKSGFKSASFLDENFYSGTNGILAFNNSGGSHVTLSRVASPTGTPTTSGYVLQIVHNGTTTSPGFGGFRFSAATRANAIIVARFKAQLAVGYTINFSTNSAGTNYQGYWCTNNVGTGKWEEYVYVVICGDTGTFSTTHLFYLTGSPTPSSGSPLTWYICAASIYDITDQRTDILYLDKAASAANVKGYGQGDIVVDSKDNAGIVGLQYYHTGNVVVAGGGGKVRVGGTTTPVETLDVAGGGAFTNYLRVTAGSGAQNFLIGNQDGAGVDRPAVIQGSNATIFFGTGTSWTGSGGSISNYASWSFAGSSLSGGSGTTPTLIINPNGSSWSQGIRVNPSSVDTVSSVSFPVVANDQTAWTVGKLATTTYSDAFAVLKNGFTGGVAARADAAFDINASTGRTTFGYNPYVGANVIWHAGNLTNLNQLTNPGFALANGDVQFNTVDSTHGYYSGLTMINAGNYSGGATPATGYLITTDIPATQFHMPKIIIEGYANGDSEPIRIELVYHFSPQNATTGAFGSYKAYYQGWDPGTVSLALNASNNIVIHLGNNAYYIRFSVDYISDGLGIAYREWTVTEAACPLTKKVSMTPFKVWTSNNLTNLSQLTNGPGYVSSYYTAPLDFRGGSHMFHSSGRGAPVINTGTWAMQIGPATQRITTAGSYYAGIAFNHNLNYSGGTLNSDSGTNNVSPHAWVGLRLYDTSGSERSYLVFATKPGTGSTNTGTNLPVERMAIDPINGYVGINQSTPAYYLDVNGTVRLATNSYIPNVFVQSSNFASLTANSPTYGLGTSNVVGWDSLNTMMQLSGGYGLRLRSQNNYLDIGGPGDSVQINGNTILHAGNYTTYTIGVSGGTVSGNLYVAPGYSFVAQGSGNNGGLALGNASTYWGLVWNYAANDWRIGYGSQISQQNWNMRWDNTGIAWSNLSHRAPLFYDSDDTGYYLDPNSTSQSALRIRGGALHGPNPTWGKYLLVGGDGRQGYVDNVDVASVSTTNGNLHLDAASTFATYINYYDGAQIYFGNGANGSIGEVSVANGISSYGASRGTIFYDYNNTGFYLDPNATSNLSVIETTEAYTTGWFRNRTSGQGLYNQAVGTHWYSNNGYWKMSSGGNTYGGIVAYQSYESSLKGYTGYWDGSGFGMLNSSGNWQIRIEYGNANMELYRITYMNDARAYIYYDRDNTGYYTDPASTSNLNVLNTLGQAFGYLDNRYSGGNSGLGTRAYSIYQETGGWSFPYPDLRIANHTGLKFGANAGYEGMRFYTDYDMSGIVFQINGSSNYLFKYVWMYTNTTGMYSDTNGAHIYPNPNSYGSWRIDGTRNGWAGIEFVGHTTLMMNDDSYGFHRNSQGWRFYVTGGNGYFPGEVTAYWSDRRLKENIQALDSGEGLALINRLVPSRFTWKKEAEHVTQNAVYGGQEEVSMIAQETQAVIPWAVKVNKVGKKHVIDGEEITDYLTINYDKITPYIIQAVKDLKQEIEELKQQLKGK
jgi:hypothetical protein